MTPVLCLVTDRRRWGTAWEDALVEQARGAARAGVHLIQVREPDLDGGPLAALVTRMLRAVAGTRTRVVVNERLDVALATGAHGVHLRGASFDARRARALGPRPFLIGRSVHSVADIGPETAYLDYVIFGTVFASTSKPGGVGVGLAALGAAVAAIPVPVLAIGGIEPASVAQVVHTGAAGVAAIGAFVPDPAAAAARFLAGR